MYNCMVSRTVCQRILFWRCFWYEEKLGLLFLAVSFGVCRYFNVSFINNLGEYLYFFVVNLTILKYINYLSKIVFKWK